MTLNLCRLLAPVAVVVAVAPAQAQQLQQQLPPQQLQQQQQQQQNPTCARLEAQLQAFERGGMDPTRADQVRRFEEAAANQQAEIDRQEAAARRAGCDNNSFFVLFTGQSAQCGPINNKIQQMRTNLDRIHADLESMKSTGTPEREGQRRAILAALSQNSCGPQYQQAVAPAPRPGNILESLFGGRSPAPQPAPGEPYTPVPGGLNPGGTYRTVCVRTCDGFFYPISNSASPARFTEDEKLCRQSCPAAEASLYAYRNPGEDINQAVSVSTQQPYTALPNAFRYRQAFDQSCSCRHAGESWSQALKNVEDPTVEQGDIVVNEQNARTLSQPRVDAQGRPIRQAPAARTPARPDPKAVQTTAPAQAPAAPAATAAPAPASTASTNEGQVKPDPNRKVRSVGPTFLPGQ